MARLMVYRAPGEHRRCPACESTLVLPLALHKFPREAGARRTGFVSGCDACGLVFVNPVPSSEELAAFYSHDGAWRAGRGPRQPKPERPRKVGGGSWVRLFDAIRGDLSVTRPPAGARVLDFGCGSGKFLDVLKPCGWETFGLEPATEDAFPRHARLTEIPQTPTFDLVIAHHVLEHVTNPLALLRQFASAARPGGYLLVAVPRLDTLPVHRDYEYVINRAHVTAYTWPCMQNLLMRSGWKPVATPADEVTISGGRRTQARLRVLARRAPDGLPVTGRPLESARAALRAYYGESAPPRRALERLGLVRLAARVIESRRQLRKWAGVTQALRSRRIEH